MFMILVYLIYVVKYIYAILIPHVIYKRHVSTLGWEQKELHISPLLGCRMHLFGAIIWRMKCPLKMKFFCWLDLRHSIPTWDLKIHHFWYGPSWCILCKLDCETTDHLFTTCPYNISIWKHISREKGCTFAWQGQNLREALHNWSQQVEA